MASTKIPDTLTGRDLEIAKLAVAEKPRWCHICKGRWGTGARIAFTRWGPDPNEWGTTHADCATEFIELENVKLTDYRRMLERRRQGNGEVDADETQVTLAYVAPTPDAERRRGDRYRTIHRGRVEYRTGDKRKAVAVSDYINAQEGS